MTLNDLLDSLLSDQMALLVDSKGETLVRIREVEVTENGEVAIRYEGGSVRLGDLRALILQDPSE